MINNKSNRNDNLLFTNSALLLFIFYVIVITVFSIINPKYMSLLNLRVITSNISYLGIVVIGQFLVVIAGGFDLSVGSLVGLTSVICVLLLSLHLPVSIVILLAILFGTFIGAINGAIYKYLGVNSIVTTLGTASILGGIGIFLANSENFMRGLPNKERINDVVFTNFARGYIGKLLPKSFLYTIILFIIIWLLLKYTTYGRSIYYVGGSSQIARIMGINSKFIQFSTFVLSGAFAAFAGIVLAGQLAIGKPEIGATATIESLTIVILGGTVISGGKGDVPSVLIAMLIIGSIATGLSLINVSIYFRQVITGLVLVMAMGFNNIKTQGFNVGAI